MVLAVVIGLIVGLSMRATRTPNLELVLVLIAILSTQTDVK